VTGGVSVANVGATLPTDAVTALSTTGANPFSAVGYVTDSGVVKSEKRNTGVINAWGGDTIAATRKGMDVSFKLELAEFLNAVVQGLIYGDSNVTSQGSVAALAAPTITLGASAGTGGTFTAGTYYWKATWVNANGETVGSNELSASVAANGTQVITVNTAPAGATNWKLYRGTTAGGESVLVATTAAATTSYTDTGAAGTAGTVPTTDSTGRGTRLTINGTSAPTPKKSWVFDVFSDVARVRIVVPIGRVMDVGDTTFKDDAIAAAVTTIQAFPDSSGRFFYTYTDDGVHA
jgi:hypothetical protein